MLSKQIIRKQVEELSTLFKSESLSEEAKLSRSYTLLGLMKILELSQENGIEYITDGSRDFKIDAI